jgi:hypothetical protein
MVRSVLMRYLEVLHNNSLKSILDQHRALLKCRDKKGLVLVLTVRTEEMTDWFIKMRILAGSFQNTTA